MRKNVSAPDIAAGEPGSFAMHHLYLLQDTAELLYYYCQTAAHLSPDKPVHGLVSLCSHYF